MVFMIRDRSVTFLYSFIFHGKDLAVRRKYRLTKVKMPVRIKHQEDPLFRINGIDQYIFAVDIQI